MHTPRLAHCVWPLSPLQGAVPAARRSRFCGTPRMNTEMHADMNIDRASVGLQKFEYV